MKANELREAAKLMDDGHRYRNLADKIACPHRMGVASRNCGLCDDEGRTVERYVETAPELLRQRDAAVDILREMTALKDLKARAEAYIAERGGICKTLADSKEYAEMRNDYDSRKPLAWESARTLLASIDGGEHG